MNPLEIVRKLLEERVWVQRIVDEASVALPKRGHVWIASFTGLWGQETRTTGSRDKATALRIAQELEAAARAERAKLGGTRKKQTMRIRHSPGSTGAGLTQREVAAVMGLSERAVRAIERRALRKLARHPALQELWREYLTGELTEQGPRLSPAEVEALLGLVRTREELRALREVLAIAQGC